MYEPEFNCVILPLLEAGAVDALEWSFDTVKSIAALPGWTRDLLKEFSRADRLYGHGVYYSLFSGGWYERHDAWFHHLEEVLREYRFCHISEHFGFMSSSNAHEGAPLPVPFCPAALDLGIHRLQMLQAAVDVPIGIENLAFAFSEQDVLKHGLFLKELIEPVNGFILLDLHNIYCQAANFGIDALALIVSYPLERVREIHVSGGSWEDSPYSTSPIRRDTHDHAIPEEIFALLEKTLPLCSHLNVVIVERLGDSFLNEADEALFREDFLRIRQIVQHFSNASQPWPYMISETFNDSFPLPMTDNNLEEQQAVILQILKDACDADTARQRLLNSIVIDQSLWHTELWQSSMIDTAMKLGKNWGINALNQ